MKLPKELQKEKKENKKIGNFCNPSDKRCDRGLNLTDQQRINIIMNLICPKCNGITSFINNLCKKGKVLILFRKCDFCSKAYEFPYKNDVFSNLELMWEKVKNETTKRKHLCRNSINLIIDEKGKSNTREDCKNYKF